LYINFFQPVLKLVGKERVDGKAIRTYDQAQTPYRRVLALDTIASTVKANLIVQYLQLNPVKLRDSIDAKVAQLWENCSVTFSFEACFPYSNILF